MRDLLLLENIRDAHQLWLPFTVREKPHLEQKFIDIMDLVECAKLMTASPKVDPTF